MLNYYGSTVIHNLLIIFFVLLDIILYDSLVFRCLGIGVSIGPSVSIVVSPVVEIVVISSTIVVVIVAGIEVNIHVHSLPAARVRAIAIVASCGDTAINTGVTAEIKYFSLKYFCPFPSQNIFIGVPDVADIISCFVDCLMLIGGSVY